MIYYTNWDKIEDFEGLYKEWTGKSINSNFFPLINAQFILARDNGKFVGIAHWTIINDPFWNLKWARLETIYVKKGYRRQGIGKELVRHLIFDATNLDCSFIRLDTEHGNDIARTFYKSLGFTEDYSYYWRIKTWLKE